MEDVTIGRIVEFFPNGNEYNPLPNNMVTAPAMVVQVFGPHVNLNVFTAETSGNPVKPAWSICHRSDVPLDEHGQVVPGVSYWDWNIKK